MVQFSEGPHFSGMDKAKDTAEGWGKHALGFNSLGRNHRTPRLQWKLDEPRDYSLWLHVRDDQEYCPVKFFSTTSWDPFTG